MSENLDLVRSIFTAWERGDYSRTDWAHPDIEFVLADGPDPGSVRGMGEMATAWRGRMSAWQQYRTQADEYRGVGDERVLVLVHAVARGKTSGMGLGHTPAIGAGVFSLRDGKVTKLTIYFARERALADLGLEERVPDESTTPDPADLVRGFFAAVNRRDVDAIEDFYAPHAVLRGAEIGTLAGPEAIRSFFEDVLSRYDEFHGELEEIVELGNGVGFVVTVCKGRPVGSEEEVQLRLASVLVGTESVIEQQTNYIDVDEARVAAERLAKSRE